MAEGIFWLTIGIIFYTYLGYPVLILLLSLLFNNRVKKGDVEPTVTLLITAYNEEKYIREKLKNTLGLDYPRNKLEIIVASDASTDMTDEIVKEFSERGVILHRVEGRLGKTATQNSAVKIAKGDIIVFSDAASMYDRDAIRALVRNYADPSVGAVSGRYIYVNPKKSSVGFATILFWNYENFIKSRQTKIKTITGCCGCIYSVRKALYTELPPSIISDLVEPLTILKKGYRIVFESEALAYEETTEKPRDEFMMRVRVIVRGMNGLIYMKSLLNPFKYPFVSFQLISHKVLRWLVPVFCILIFISNLFLAPVNIVYQILLSAQSMFYLFAFIGIFLERKGVKKKIFYLPLYFCIVNLASLISMFKVFKKENITTWQTQR